MKGLKWYRNFFMNLLWILLASMAILLVTGYFLSKKYEDELKEWSVARINQTVDTKISIQGMDASFLRTFPHLSVVLKDVVVWSSPSFEKQEFTGIGTDSMFTAEKIYLQFNAIDLLRSKVRIQKIFAEHGQINLLIDSHGQTNYQVLRQEEPKAPENPNKKRVFELEALRLTGFYLEFNNLSKKTYSSTTIDDLLLKGKFSGTNFSIGTNAGMVLHDFTRNGFRYANDYQISLRMILEMKDHLASIRKGELVLNTIRLNTNGNISLGDDLSLDLGMVSRNINISTLLSSFPQKIKEKIPFRAQGRGDLAIRVQGPISATKVPSIQSVYVLNLNQLSFQEESFRNIRLKGTYTNGEHRSPSTTQIDVRKFQIDDRNSIAQGSIFIENLVRPDIRLNLSGTIDAGQLMAMLPLKNKLSFQGTLVPDFAFRTRLNSFKDINLSILGTADMSGMIVVKNMDAIIEDLPEFHDINGKISFKNKSWYPELTMLIGRSDLAINARTGHIPDMLIKDDQTLNIQAIVTSNFFDLEPFLGKKKEKSEEGEPDQAFSLPSFIIGSFNCNVKKLNTGNFSLDNVSALVKLSPKKVSIPQITFHAMNGSASGLLEASQDLSGEIYLTSTSQLEKIDIKQLFEGFNNFGQESLKAEHVGGAVTGKLRFNAQFDSTLAIRNDKIITEADLIIKNGELVHFEPLQKLSTFVEMDELEHIRFSTLENTIIIRNSQMIIPEMDINSNAFNITASGSHAFNGHFEYKVKILLSELLTGKTKHSKSEFYMMEEDRRASLYLSIAGTADDYKIKYDKKEALAAIKKDLQEEKNTIKTILHEEFGFFKKDSLKQTTTQKEGSGIIFQWEDDSLLSPEKQKKHELFEKNKNKNDGIKNTRQEDEFILDWDDDDDG